MPKSTKCPKCQNRMEAGFIPDLSYGAVALASWVEGVPEKGWTGSVKLRAKTQTPILAYRCVSCGFLENYAPTAEASKS
jgi:hypothetical protein